LRALQEIRHDCLPPFTADIQASRTEIGKLFSGIADCNEWAQFPQRDRKSFFLGKRGSLNRPQDVSQKTSGCTVCAPGTHHQRQRLIDLVITKRPEI
jgi:hypothetical protein